MSFEIYKNLAWLNELPRAEAESTFRDCCGSAAWASRMAASRPFPMLENLYAAAEDIWFSLPSADHLEAFAAHPQIGSKSAAPSQKKQAAEWSAGEQSGVSHAADSVREQLADANRLYKNKFGFIFIVYASGKTADEMLAICRARQGNSVETELKIAAQEQHKITETRLNKLLEK
ncbi:MAG: 2-oxo-4-hydroxy-4-carboxy-5-ureidoimidazoline decarboxylase [Chloracidobacterium sp.]|nr:2-oxo-4-hydroxy-4-carboxy-5-ureidoimidazoline decarboxylase [Chloracidobacterium sp.]